MYNEYFPLGDFELMGKLAQHFSLKKLDASFRKGKGGSQKIKMEI